MSEKKQRLKASTIDVIDGILKEIHREHKLTDADIKYSYKNTGLVLIVGLSEKLYDIIAHQHMEGDGNKTFMRKEDDNYLMDIYANGNEFYYFAKILEAVLLRLNREKKQRVCANRQRIDDALDEAIEASGILIICPRTSGYKQGKYSAMVHIGNDNVHSRKEDIEALILEIQVEFPRRIKEKCPITSKD